MGLTFLGRTWKGFLNLQWTVLEDLKMGAEGRLVEAYPSRSAVACPLLEVSVKGLLPCFLTNGLPVPEETTRVGVVEILAVAPKG